jgi:hypothetical protein
MSSWRGSAYGDVVMVFGASGVEVGCFPSGANAGGLGAGDGGSLGLAGSWGVLLSVLGACVSVGDLRIRGALGGTRTPNLLIRSPVPVVR